MHVVFDTRELYFLTQYDPVRRALERRGVRCSFVAYHNRPTMLDAMRIAFERDGLDVTWCETKEDGLAHYRALRPDWVFFGNGYRFVGDLAPCTRTAMLYHGIGMKNGTYAPGPMGMDVRFVEGPARERRLRELYPDARLERVGHAKLDPLFGPPSGRPRADLAELGLDPRKPTLLYAPTHSPSSFPNVPDRWPSDFAGFNLIVKPHYLSFFGSARRGHRRKMAVWAEAPNCWVAPIERWDPLPYMAVADLLVSDVSAMVYEFAALGRPVVSCDFVKLHPLRRGPFRYRFLRRMSEDYLRYADVAAHARRYRDLAGVVERELEHPALRAEVRARVTAEVVGELDGRASERIADLLLAERTTRFQSAPSSSSATSHRTAEAV
jgi:hypothetical protein